MKKITEYLFEKLENINDPNKILYIAIVLNETSHKELMNFAKDKLSKNQDFKPDYKCHHMTVVYNNGRIDDKFIKWADQHINSEFDLTAIRYGISDKACAVEIDTNAECANILKHVTLATNQNTGGKPVDSNYIENWEPLQHRIQLKGSLKIYYKK